MPFVQGHLREEPLSFTIETECGHCRAPLRIEVDSGLAYRVLTADAQPLVYVPQVDLSKLGTPSIIDSF